MAIQATSAAKTLAENSESISSHQLISLLLAGGLERISQAKSSLSEGKTKDAEVLLQKIIGIISGLRNSLDFERGGEIAVNLNSLYDYMLGRIDAAPEAARLAVVEEVGELLSEVKAAWDKMYADAPEL